MLALETLLLICSSIVSDIIVTFYRATLCWHSICCRRVSVCQSVCSSVYLLQDDVTPINAIYVFVLVFLKSEATFLQSGCLSVAQ